MPDILWVSVAAVCVFFGPGLLVFYPSLRRNPIDTFVRAFVVSGFLCICAGLLTARFKLFPLALPLAFLGAVFLRFLRGTRADESTEPRTTLLWGSLCALIAVAFHAHEITQSAAIRGGFFYLSEIQYFLELGGVPNKVQHFGMDITPQVDKIGFDLWGVLFSMLAGHDVLLIKKVGYVFVLLIGSLTAFSLLAQLSTAAVASAATTLLFANVYIGSAVALRAFFIPESLALVFLFCAWHFWIRLRKSRYTSREELLLCIAALGACATVHLEITALAALFITLDAFNGSIVERHTVHIKTLGIVGAASILMLILSYLSIGTMPGFLGAAGQIADLPDQSWQYFAASDIRFQDASAPVRSGVRDVLLEIIHANGLALRTPLGAMLLLCLFVAALLTSMWRLKREYRYQLASSAGLSCLALVLIAVLSNAVASTWIYQTEVTRRLAPYSYVFVLMMLVSLSGILLAQTRHIAVGLACFAISAIFVALSFPYASPVKTAFPTSSAAVASLTWLRENPSNGKIISNVASNGAFHVLAGATSVTEGHQPMLRPVLLDKTITILERSRRFFASPSETYLEEFGIDTVVISRERSDFGGTRFADTFSKEAPPAFLCLQKEFGHIEIYRQCEHS